jgi:hypothetical protein
MTTEKIQKDKYPCSLLWGGGGGGGERLQLVPKSLTGENTVPTGIRSKKPLGNLHLVNCIMFIKELHMIVDMKPRNERNAANSEVLLTCEP